MSKQLWSLDVNLVTYLCEISAERDRGLDPVRKVTSHTIPLLHTETSHRGSHPVNAVDQLGAGQDLAHPWNVRLSAEKYCRSIVPHPDCARSESEQVLRIVEPGAREPFCVHRIQIAPEHSFRSCREPNIKVFADRTPECFQIPNRPLKQAPAIVEMQRLVLPKPLPKPRKVAIPNLLGMRMPERFCSVGTV